MFVELRELLRSGAIRGYQGLRENLDTKPEVKVQRNSSYKQNKRRKL